MAEEGAYVVEEVTISESDDEFEYQSVELDSEVQEFAEDEDYEAIMRATQAHSEHAEPSLGPVESKFTFRHESTDDFVRNFLVRLGMTKTIEVFQAEWYELKAKGKLKNEDIAPVPDVYLKNQELRELVSTMRTELEKAQYVAEKAKGTWDKLRKEKDFHRMHHHRVQQEKQKLVTDIDKLKKAHEQYEAKYKELASKYEAAMKEKMLMKLERDRLRGKVGTLELTLTHSQQESTPPPVELKKDTSKGRTQKLK